MFRSPTYLPRGGRTADEEFGEPNISRFQLTRPAGGEPVPCTATGIPFEVSTHSPRGGRTPSQYTTTAAIVSFNSLAPRGGRTPNSDGSISSPAMFQLTRPAGGEPAFRSKVYYYDRVSTHSPRGGRTFGCRSLRNANHRFQLTRPAGGEPLQAYDPEHDKQSFNSLAPRRANPAICCAL